MQSGTWRTRGIAWSAVLLWHLLAGWWLLHAVPSARRAARDDVLRIVYVPLSLPSPPPPPSPPIRVVQSSQPVREAAARPRQVRGTSLVAVDPLIALPPSRSLLEQARDMGQQRDEAASNFRNDPFADRPARLPTADANRFRMRDPITPARVLAWVGQHVTSPAGYEKDPCPRNKRNIEGMLAQGDSSRLQMELEFERRHCRP